MHDKYGIPKETYTMQKRRYERARAAYELECKNNSVVADWENLDATDRHQWLMHIKMLDERELAAELITADYVPPMKN